MISSFIQARAIICLSLKENTGGNLLNAWHFFPPPYYYLRQYVKMGYIFRPTPHLLSFMGLGRFIWMISINNKP